MKTLKPFKRYIPILLKAKLDHITYPRKDNLYTIIDLISRKEIYFKSDLQKNYGYTEIAKKQFKELLPSSDNLQADLEFLVENALILRNENYKQNYRCKSYKIPVEFLGKSVGIFIQNKNINRRIYKQIKKYKALKVKSLEFAQSEYYKTFKIDFNGANKAIFENAIAEIKFLCTKIDLCLSDTEIQNIIGCHDNFERSRGLILMNKNGIELNNILHRFMIYSMRINAINDGFLFFKRNETNGRLDTNLTSLPSFLRPFIISDERLISIDIKNSQPYFLYTLIRNNPKIDKDELNNYADLVINGFLYEFLKERFNAATGYFRTRKQIKEMLFKIYYSKITSFTKNKQFFGSLFPTIMNFINETNAEKHNTLAVQLQTIESYNILDVVMPELEKQGIRPFTIHDSFVCKKSEANTIEKVLKNKLIEFHEIAPALHIGFIDEIEAQVDKATLIPWDGLTDELNASWEDSDDNYYGMVA